MSCSTCSASFNNSLRFPMSCSKCSTSSNSSLCFPMSCSTCSASSNSSLCFLVQLIFSGEYTKAMSKDWHSEHFCCWQCDESLTGQRYVLKDDHPYCTRCYESVFANTCDDCNQVIGIDSKVRNPSCCTYNSSSIGIP